MEAAVDVSRPTGQRRGMVVVLSSSHIRGLRPRIQIKVVDGKSWSHAGSRRGFALVLR